MSRKINRLTELYVLKKHFESKIREGQTMLKQDEFALTGIIEDIAYELEQSKKQKELKSKKEEKLLWKR